MTKAFRLTIYGLFLCCSFLLAQPISTVHTFTVNDGLPSNAITTIRQDCHGLIWIATWNGLCCYDGNRFTAFKGEDWGSDNALTTQRLAAIEPDSQGNIWVRTYGGGLYFFDTHKCEYVNIGLLLQRRYGKVILPRNIYCLPTGYTWINDEHGQLNLRIDDRYPGDIDHMEVIGNEDMLNGHYINKVEADSLGHEWVMTDDGMIRYDTKEFVATVKKNDDNKELTIDDKRGPAEAYVAAHEVEKHFIDRQGNLWMISPRGLSLVNFRNPPMQLLPLEGTTQTRSLLCCQDGMLWVGTRDGVLAMFDANGAIVGRRHFSSYIYAMHEDRQGNVWIGTKGDGLFIFEKNRGKGKNMLPAATLHLTHDAANPYSLSSNDVYDIDEDEQGNVWIATWGGGVNYVSLSDKEQTINDRLRFIHKDNEMKGYPKEDFDKVRRITHDRHGNIIVSTTSGLMTLASPQEKTGWHFHVTCQVPNDTTSLRTNDVMQTLVCRNGDVYVATMGSNIQKMVSDNLLKDSLRFLTVKNMKQGNGNIWSMIEDRQGDIWVVRESEVNRYDVSTGRLEQFGPNSMSGPTELTEAKPVMDAKGNIWIGTVGGMMTFNATQMHKSDYRPGIVFSSLRYQGEQQEQPILYRQSIKVNPRQRNLTISFSALDYEDNYLMQYAYKIVEKGIGKSKEGEWNIIGSPNIAFSELSPGKHLLVVKSTNSDGVWTDNEATLTIDVEYLWWEHEWVQLLMLLAVIALCTWGIIAWLSHRQTAKEREQRLENILRQYRELQEKTAVREYKLAEPQIVNEDEVMMDQLMKFLEQHLDDDTLRIDDMAEAVNMGRTVFYEKIRNLVGVSPSDFLRQVRMQRARQLVGQSKMTFSQIAYAVGFTDPKYFTKCFKKDTGMTPSEYRTRKLT